MNLTHFVPPAHPYSSTPKAARQLLRLFGLALVVGVYLGAYSYLHSAFEEEVSARRGFMNEAASDAQSFFVSRQTLLQSLGVSAVRHLTPPVGNLNNVPAEEVHITLGEPGNLWSLWLTRRMLGHLKANRINLIYVPQRPGSAVQRLYSAWPTAAVPGEVLQRLLAVDTGAVPATDELWLTEQNRLDSPLYLFTRLDDRSPASGWLGFEVDGPDLIQALRHEQAGDFLLLDGDGTLIFSSSLQPPQAVLALRHARAGATFGWEGGGWLPDRLAIRKQLAYSHWQIVYRLDLHALLPALALPLLLAVLLCLAATGLMVWWIGRIDQRLIVPAAARIEALVESEAFSSTVIRIAPVALCVLRRSDGAVVLENPLAQQWLGDGRERQRLSHRWITRAFDAAEASCRDELQLADGRHLFLSYAPTRYQREDVLICAFSDISERKQAELALQQARALADAANEAKTLFLATMSHEIRTPLYGVLGTLELLGRTRLDSQQRGYLKAIEGSSATLLQLICDVLDVSKIEAGQLALELSTFCVTTLTQEVVQSYAGAAQSKGLQLFASIDPGVPEQVHGDLTRIRQILNNLLSNALKFTDSGRIVVRLHTDSREGERALLQWQVVDTGKGICASDQRHLFEPFFQSSPNANVVAGTGLGLSICKRLVHLMNGNLRVFSEPGLGSSFTFALPLEQVPSAQAQSEAQMQPLLGERVYVVSPVQELAECCAGWLRRWGARAQVALPELGQVASDAVLVELSPGPAAAMRWHAWPGRHVRVAAGEHGMVRESGACWRVGLNDLLALNQAVSQAQGLELQPCVERGHPLAETQLNLRLLVAEDNLINQLILRDQLEELGCSVMLARDGFEALSMWSDADFDIILTDVNMPRMNGYQLTEQLRRLGCSLPIIGATANAMLEEAERCLSMGMDHFLVKPFTLHALYQCLQPYQRTLP
ncbi:MULTISPECIES: ATP-binding protein [unclassified Pseudomonas]|uniref:ATP-binding protein n=1 Tax=unclassified Pseudomonas TaxID=196821 RepID=UPI000BD6E1DC|nr:MULTISPECIES: ATP-binding protein [unclassified Pseudomonas]PVZ12662.1 two-component system capsular synthesis sensor histidine kinase RcsC [Pseudomonas sp. URIL14HWK12:I12]PVZ23187.1 two-component system capsular synthesis sensor histidine kinase RcsC [Pseudomonas sp. URIL14HWK12:I10]PVZ32516.1 two-component system capsular synthesis sensor histidine kinase RcsC [Pseudomonas sp. URIL14HWK12:I11]SNZ13580.1 two-component system, NarL family, capsular synthesis sensor histidine kinase RcsC [Ps